MDTIANRFQLPPSRHAKTSFIYLIISSDKKNICLDVDSDGSGAP